MAYEPTNRPEIRSKYTTEDIQRATERAEQFLVSQESTTLLPATREYNKSTGDISFVLVRQALIALLADYDLTMLDDMFNAAGGQDESDAGN